jgi:hypothetical protein
MVFWNPFSWFKKEEESEYPRDFAVVMLTDIAKKNNINDDFNKKIVRFKGGKVFKEYKYSEENIKNLKEIAEIPIMEETLKNEYDFHQGVEYGQVKN